MSLFLSCYYLLTTLKCLPRGGLSWLTGFLPAYFSGQIPYKETNKHPNSMWASWGEIPPAHVHILVQSYCEYKEQYSMGGDSKGTAESCWVQSDQFQTSGYVLGTAQPCLLWHYPRYCGYTAVYTLTNPMRASMRTCTRGGGSQSVDVAIMFVNYDRGAPNRSHSDPGLSQPIKDTGGWLAWAQVRAVEDWIAPVQDHAGHATFPLCPACAQLLAHTWHIPFPEHWGLVGGCYRKQQIHLHHLSTIRGFPCRGRNASSGLFWLL